MLLNCVVGEDSWESLGLQGDPTSPSWRKSVLNIHWKDWCWSWNSNALATWCEDLTHWKKPWYWERLKAGREGDDREWDGWMASLTQWTWVSVNSGSWWWTGRPACCGPWGCKESDPAEWLNWTELDVRMRKSIPTQADEKPWVPEEERGVWGSRGGNRVQELSRRKKGQTSFFSPLNSLFLVS